MKIKGKTVGKLTLRKIILAILSHSENIYTKIYSSLSGSHPNQNILHDEWLSLKDINGDIKGLSPQVRGKVLDVGCGSKPYSGWFTRASKYIGLDVWNNPIADIIVKENQKWPVANSSIDSVVSFQTFEHIKDTGFVLNEINRVLKPGGIVLLTIPFIAYEHGAPSDYQRYTQNGIRQLFPKYHNTKVITQGGLGSCSGTIMLRFIRISMNLNAKRKLLWQFLLPIWIPFTLIINVIGSIVDKIDKTGCFYPNVLILTKKPTKLPGKENKYKNHTVKRK